MALETASSLRPQTFRGSYWFFVLREYLPPLLTEILSTLSQRVAAQIKLFFNPLRALTCSIHFHCSTSLQNMGLPKAVSLHRTPTHPGGCVSVQQLERASQGTQRAPAWTVTRIYTAFNLGLSSLKHTQISVKSRRKKQEKKQEAREEELRHQLEQTGKQPLKTFSYLH